MKTINFVILLCSFGSGSKLLQAYLSNVKNLFTLPAYPLLYLPDCYFSWEKEKNLNSNLLLKLLSEQFSSIFDTRNLEGFNGTNQLGKDKSDYISISKEKFDTFFLDYFKNNTINLKNLIIAIHLSYQKAINEENSLILYHPHSLETYFKYLSIDFYKSKKILTIREPIRNFWRSAFADNNIDNSRFDNSDYENLKNYRYINRLRDLNINFNYYQNKKFKDFKIIKFEELKKNNVSVLKELCKFLNLEFNESKILIPRFNNKEWWGSNIYKGSQENYRSSKIQSSQENDLKNFFNYEIEILQKILLPFYNKFNYKYICKINLVTSLFFWISIFFPTKYGLNLFIERFKFKNIKSYILNSFDESFNFNLKNYYFNAMYKHKYSYRICYIQKYNFLRKYLFIKKKIFLSLLNFILKMFLYPIIQLELFILYFVRISLIFSIKKKLSRLDIKNK